MNNKNNDVKPLAPVKLEKIRIGDTCIQLSPELIVRLNAAIRNVPIVKERYITLADGNSAYSDELFDGYVELKLIQEVQNEVRPIEQF